MLGITLDQGMPGVSAPMVLYLVFQTYNPLAAIRVVQAQGYKDMHGIPRH